MIIGDRLRELRKAKKLSQADIEQRTGLLRPYLSRVENGHSVPAIETLEKIARALDTPMYQLFYDGENPPELPNFKWKSGKRRGNSGKDARLLSKFRRLFGLMKNGDRQLLILTAQRMVRTKTR